ncbi:uncharacterized aromatic compound monooxygenase YhjG [Arthrobacter sp. Hiyo1]|uniref:FAD-dependent oxidoreductase n=1 Tax=Arthrobacter sp. Hiyo1 TaxID=1588020 RepID=UPI0006A38C02|nr:uncharacterized aromatic compound monooxygenase YhjG [Arthrobacter sp. Hiyo1]
MFDVVVVGAGPVGLCMAALLLQNGHRVAVLERRATSGRQTRAIGIHPPALAALDAVGAAHPLVSSGVRITHGAAYSGGRKVADMDFARPSAEYPFILSVPQYLTTHALESRVIDLDPGALHRGVQVEEVVDDGGHLRLRGQKSGAPVEFLGRFVVAADGVHSAVREGLGLEPRLRTYPDYYVMGDFRDDSTYGDNAVLFLEPGGIVESFPLPDGIRRWVVRLGAPCQEPTPHALAALIKKRTGSAVDSASNTMISAFGVTSRMVSRMIHGRVALIGDAAHEISPIGGQGMNLLVGRRCLGADHQRSIANIRGRPCHQGTRWIRAGPAACSEESHLAGQPQHGAGPPLAPEGPQRKERGDRPSHHLADVLGACCP